MLVHIGVASARGNQASTTSPPHKRRATLCGSGRRLRLVKVVAVRSLLDPKRWPIVRARFDAARRRPVQWRAANVALDHAALRGTNAPHEIALVGNVR